MPKLYCLPKHRAWPHMEELLCQGVPGIMFAFGAGRIIKGAGKTLSKTEIVLEAAKADPGNTSEVLGIEARKEGWFLRDSPAGPVREPSGRRCYQNHNKADIHGLLFMTGKSFILAFLLEQPASQGHRMSVNHLQHGGYDLGVQAADRSPPKGSVRFMSWKAANRTMDGR